MLHGYDISGYQAASWTTKTDMLFVKATENTGYTNPHFVSQFGAAKKLAKVHGAYHFARPGSSSATAQADHFLAVVGPYLSSSTLLVLDLEVSKLGQSATNQFAKDFAARLGHRYPSHRRVLYMGGGYSATNTGAGLSKSYHAWWYPRYPFAYQIAAEAVDVDAWRAANRSDELTYADIIATEQAREVVDFGAAARTRFGATDAQSRTLLAALMTKWPTAFTPNAPAGKTGWTRPDIWQFTDNWGSHLDANVSDRSVNYLLGIKPVEDDLPYTEAQLRKMIREEVVAAFSDDSIASPMIPGDDFDPDHNPGFDPDTNPKWMPRSLWGQAIKGLVVVNRKVDAIGKKLGA